jgi:hypothetical protein
MLFKLTERKIGDTSQPDINAFDCALGCAFRVCAFGLWPITNVVAEKVREFESTLLVLVLRRKDPPKERT